MKTVPDIIDHLTLPVVAMGLNVGYSTASEMKRRASIPVKYWPDLVALCKQKRIKGVNYDLLVTLHSEKGAAA